MHNRWFPQRGLGQKHRHKRYVVVSVRNGQAKIVGMAPTNASAAWLADVYFDQHSDPGDVVVSTTIADDSVTPWWKDRLKLREFLAHMATGYGVKEDK